jgi:uncharacterized protein (TIGR01777 family)
MEKVLITGGTGMVGRYLARRLAANNYEVGILSRRAGEQDGIRIYRWDVGKQYIDPEALKGVSHIIHLAGAGIADKRWTAAYKKELVSSRLDSAAFLFEAVTSRDIKIKTFVSASAVGFYGEEVSGIAREDDPPGSDFLARLCVEWEAAASRFKRAGIRTVMIRTGVVLAKNGGYIKQVSAPIKWFAGAALGTGKQLTSWVHVDDLCGMYIKAIEDDGMSGPYNAVAPHPVTNKEITRRMAEKLKRPLLLPPVPRVVLRLVLGEVAGTLLSDQHAAPDKIKARGFVFRYPDIGSALDNVM